jgi:predicted branched-subunit amino acid permease
LVGEAAEALPAWVAGEGSSVEEAATLWGVRPLSGAGYRALGRTPSAAAARHGGPTTTVRRSEKPTAREATVSADGAASPPRSPVQSLRAGSVAIAPIVLGVIPFAVIAGFAAVDIGLRWTEALGFSTVVFAGASQLAAIELLGQGAPIGVAVLTMVVINLRMAMYSASLAPHLATEPMRRRVLGAYVLTDQAYAVAITRFLHEPTGGVDRFWFYLGAALPMWLVWQPVTVLGALVGDRVPEGLPLGFAVPLAFLALLLPAITDRPTLAAALTAALVATVGATWPSNIGMPLGAVAGVAVGFVLSRRAAAAQFEGAEEPSEPSEAPGDDGFGGTSWT